MEVGQAQTCAVKVVILHSKQKKRRKNRKDDLIWDPQREKQHFRGIADPMQTRTRTKPRPRLPSFQFQKEKNGQWTSN